MEAYRDYLYSGNLKPSRLLNAAIYLSHRGRSGSLPYHPLYYMVETGNVCRLRCPFCCQGQYDSGVHSSRSMLRYDEFLRVLGKIAPYAMILDLFKHGEPFLNPDIVRMIRAATERRIRCRINTGLNFDLDRARALDICRSGLYKIVCAIDGVTQEAYERYRVGGNLDLALRNAATLLEARRELRSRRPAMVFRMLVFEWNHYQVEAARELASRMGFDRFAADPGTFVRDGRAVEWDMQARCWRDTEWHLDSIFPASTSERPPASPRRCSSLFNTLVLHSNGSSMVCCHSSRKEWEQQSLLDKPLAEIWNSEGYVATRRIALGVELSRVAAFPQCRSCCWL
jgi:pyruvate-formate lyase-activating enzyme